jgi:hypothetical protein
MVGHQSYQSHSVRSEATDVRRQEEKIVLDLTRELMSIVILMAIAYLYLAFISLQLALMAYCT